MAGVLECPWHCFPSSVIDERVTGRKARGLQTEEIGCKCQTFLSLLSGRRKQTSDIFFFFIQILKEAYLKMLCCHYTWFYLKLTILKLWVNQYIFFFYGNVCLKICSFTSDSVSSAYVRSFLYLLYTLIKLYYTKALSDPASSLAPYWIRLLWRPRIPVSYHSATTFQYECKHRDIYQRKRIRVHKQSQIRLLIWFVAKKMTTDTKKKGRLFENWSWFNLHSIQRKK